MLWTKGIGFLCAGVSIVVVVKWMPWRNSKRKVLEKNHTSAFILQ
jgi:hypothetical protein